MVWNIQIRCGRMIVQQQETETSCLPQNDGERKEWVNLDKESMEEVLSVDNMREHIVRMPDHTTVIASA